MLLKQLQGTPYWTIRRDVSLPHRTHYSYTSQTFTALNMRERAEDEQWSEVRSLEIF